MFYRKACNFKEKEQCVLSFSMGWQILVSYPKPEVRDKIYEYLPTHVKTQHILASMKSLILICLNTSTNTVIYFDWKTVIYINVCGQCRTQFMLPNSSRR